MTSAHDTLVFIPAWNEEQNLPAVLDELPGELPDVDVLVVDDGSTDGRPSLAREHGAEVLSFGENRGLRAGIAAGYAWALEHGYAYAAASTPTASIPPPSCAACWSSFVPARPTSPSARASSAAPVTSRTVTSRGDRKLGTGAAAPLDAASHSAARSTTRRAALARRAKALPVLAEPYKSGAPEVQALLRLHERGLRVAEVPVDMRARAGGESKLRARRPSSSFSP